jgi:hypothetical protein
MLFECGFWSLKSNLGFRCLRNIRVVGFDPSNCFPQAGSASILFEHGFRSLGLLSSGQQRLYTIRAWALVPQIVFLRPAARPYYSSVSFGPSNRFPQVSSASILFECRFRSFESLSLGQQRLHVNRLRSSVSRFAHSRPTTPLYHSIVDFHLSKFSSCHQSSHLCPKYGGNRQIWMPYVKYGDKSTISNTRWFDIRIKRALPREFSMPMA